MQEIDVPRGKYAMMPRPPRKVPSWEACPRPEGPHVWPKPKRYNGRNHATYERLTEHETETMIAVSKIANGSTPHLATNADEIARVSGLSRARVMDSLLTLGALGHLEYYREQKRGKSK